MAVWPYQLIDQLIDCLPVPHCRLLSLALSTLCLPPPPQELYLRCHLEEGLRAELSYNPDTSTTSLRVGCSV